jgi:hypothetical protein
MTYEPKSGDYVTVAGHRGVIWVVEEEFMDMVQVVVQYENEDGETFIGYDYDVVPTPTGQWIGRMVGDDRMFQFDADDMTLYEDHVCFMRTGRIHMVKYAGKVVINLIKGEPQPDKFGDYDDEDGPPTCPRCGEPCHWCEEDFNDEV